MTKESNTFTQALEAMEQEFFFTNSIKEVSHDLDRAFVCFMQSDDADDMESRMNFFASYWAVKRSLHCIAVKQDPKKCDAIICSFLM
ncbi:hypothetical protein V3Q77_08225 [Flavobacterium davisii]|uniref:Uncharacterized protein n=1 Tax=Flavobacterium davisii TaxID=2906077 RepID=A0ABW8PQP5_9FLAO